MTAPLVIDQPPGGYRVNGDSFALARFVDTAGVRSLLDVGAGVGALSLPLALETPGLVVTALDIDPVAARAARMNARASGVAGRYRVVLGDALTLAALFPARPFDRVVANPPYYPLRASRPSPDPVRDAARREVRMTLAQLVESAAAVLAPGGRLALSMTGVRRDEYLHLLARHRFVELRHETRGRIFLSEARHEP